MTVRIEGPAVLPVRHGIFSVAEVRSVTDPHTFLGVDWVGPGCGPLDLLIACPAGDAATSKDLNNSDISVGQAEAFTAVGVAKCSPVGFDFETARGLALQRLLRGEEGAVERAVLFGEDVAGLGLAGTAASGGAASDPLEALALMERRVAGAYQSLGVLWIDRYTASYLAESGALRADGAVMRTRLGTPVIVLSGTGAAPATPTIYGTGQIVVLRGEPFFGTDDNGAFNARRNDVTAVAEREYVAAVDTCGGVLAELVTDGYGAGA